MGKGGGSYACNDCTSITMGVIRVNSAKELWQNEFTAKAADIQFCHGCRVMHTVRFFQHGWRVGTPAPKRRCTAMYYKRHVFILRAEEAHTSSLSFVCVCQVRVLGPLQPPTVSQLCGARLFG